MISQEKQKSVIEAMLFVSTEPVTLNKMVRKLRQIDKQTREAELAEEPSEPADAQLEQAQTEDVADDVIENTNPNPEEEQPEHLSVDSQEDSLSSKNESSEEIKKETEDEDENSADQIVEKAGETDESDDIMKQLLSKQQELDEEITPADVKLLLKEIQEEFANEHHGVELVTVAKGYQLRTKYDVSVYLKNEKVNAPTRFSPSSLETLAIVAYQQPVTRHKIEEVRGVDSGGVMKTLLDKGILRVVGRSDEPGKPLIYGTSKKFLEVFGLEKLKDLPSLQDYDSLELSQKRDEIEKQKRYAEPINLDDLVEDDYEALDEAERSVLDDLNDSIKGLRQVEKEVLISTGLKKEKTAETQGDSPAISEDSSSDAREITT